jgi:hypothetical protein
MIFALLVAALLHPGHATRLEIRQSDEGSVLEVAMRIETSDLEAALKRRHKSVVDIDSLSKSGARTIIGEYLSETLSFKSNDSDNQKLNWIGCEKHARHVWVFFELPLPQPRDAEVQLIVNSLFEVESELQHVVVLGDNVGDRTVIVSSRDKPIAIRVAAAD